MGISNEAVTFFTIIITSFLSFGVFFIAMMETLRFIFG
jgi:hypothetical protein